jgi:Cyclic nucleotide-binding domain
MFVNQPAGRLQMATPVATKKDNLGPGPVHADGGVPGRRRRAPGRVLTGPRHLRGLAAAFPHLPQPLLREMAQGLEEARFRPGEVIVREGDPADRFYIIESGQVEGTKSAAGGDVHVLTMGAGEYFGEVGLLATGTRTATVRAVSEVRVLSLGRARFQALVDASAPTADDLAQVVTDRNVPAQPRADRIPLPAWTGRLRRLLKAPWAMHYNRLIVLVLAANALLGVYGVGHWEHFGSALGAVAVVAQANIALAIIFRQQYVINFLGWLATRPPVTWPIRVRWALAKYYHFGGLHVGFALAGTVWYLTFVAMLIYGFGAGTGGVGVVDVAVSSVAAGLIVVIVFMARPSSRTKRHDTFEATHRFCGWAVLVLVWLNTIVFVASRAHGPAVSALLGAPTFWLLVVTTCGTAWPWLLLRKVPLTVERPSSHLAILHLGQDRKPPVGTTRAISRSPLYGWHQFANVPVAAGPGDRGYRMTVSRAGDWTAELIDNPPGHVWVRGIPTVDIVVVKKLFSKVAIVATGSGIGPALGHLLSAQTPSQLVWATRDATKTYGAALVDEILAAQPDAIIWNTDELGRPDMLRLAYRAYITSGAEAVICISNKTLTWNVVHGLEQRGIPAFGPVWDS